MEEDLILQQPTDRRLGNVNALPPGPPGAEFDTVDFDSKKAPPKAVEKESSSKSSRRRSPSNSPRQKRNSPSRNRRTPSPIVRRRRSRSPRRNRYFSPDRRRYDNRMRRSPPDRRRGGRDRDRYGGGRGGGGGRGRGRSDSRSRSRSASPRRGSGGAGSRWSPKKKPNSPPPTNVPPPAHLVPPPSTAQTQAPPPQAQYNVMPPQMYGGDGGYGATPAYNQYTVPPPQTGFAPQPDAYGMQAPAPPTFNAAYPPPPAWGVNDAYGQQSWMQQPVPDLQNQMQQMPPQAQVPTTAPPQLQPSPVTVQTLNVLPDAAPGTVDPNPAHDAVAQEAENQRDELKKQRSSYLKKTGVLKKELKMLKEQRKDLNSGGAPPSPTTKGFIDENEKLQNQIQKKISTIENVIDMLTGIIGEENLEKEHDDDIYESDIPKAVAKQRQSSNSEQTKKKRSSSTSSETSSGSSDSTSSSSSSSSSEDDDDDSSPERLKNKAIESMKAKAREANIKKDIPAAKLKDEKAIDERKRFNYVFYDPEMHWCQTCDIFPKTAKDFLNHLHTKEHMDRESIDTPWHLDMITDQYPTYDNAPTKRTPIRGLTFFVPATAWFCKLCNVWMGDLHCASTHLKSQLHSNKYNAFLEKNPHFEVNWLADRQRVLNDKRLMPLPPQITSVSTTAAENGSKKSKKDDEKSKKRKKKSSDKKDKKKKKKRSKKRKKAAATTSSSSSSETSSESSEQLKNKKLAIVIKDLDNPNPAASIRVAMRKQESVRLDDDMPPPPPSMTIERPPVMPANPGGRIGKWTLAQEIAAKPIPPNQHFANNEEDNKRDDAIIQQWNTVQPVISESEKKLLEQLKGKLKNKPREESSAAASSSRNVVDATDKDTRERNRERHSRGRSRDKTRRHDGDSDRVDRRRRSRSPFFGGGRGGRRGGLGGGRDRSRTRSRSRGRNSPLGRRRRSRSRSLRRRSRSYDRRRRFSRSRTRSRSRSQSGNRNRIEKAVVRHSEFRPRVPEKEKEKDKKSSDTKEKKEKDKKSKSSTATAATSGKKLPFIGKMPVFKKQTTNQTEGGVSIGGANGEKRIDEVLTPTLFVDNGTASAFTLPTQRPPAPTAAQIQMAMMEDAYGNAPPFHPDASMMVDYDDLMPDPVQFVNIMGQAPPPPPPASTQPGGVDDDELRNDNDILPPGIDELESEEFVPKPISDGPMPRKGPLPKDLEEALNIIFPGEKKPGEDDDENDAEKKTKAASGQTHIIVDEPVMQAEDLVKEGIHLVTIEETSLAGMDEASQLSMNEPLVFNKPGGAATPQAPSPPSSATALLFEDGSQNAADIDLNSIHAPPIESSPIAAVASSSSSNSNDEIKITEKPAGNFNIVQEHEQTPIIVPSPDDIPMPEATPDEVEDITSAVIYDLDDIPQPPASPTESEKNRRQEELNDLAMLGIDADDMAAQCI